MIETDLECDNGWVRIPSRREDERGRPRGAAQAKAKGESWVKRAVSEYEVLASSVSPPLLS